MIDFNSLYFLIRASDIAFLCSSDLGLRIFCFVSSENDPLGIPLFAKLNFALCSSDMDLPFNALDIFT
jgi:hypothetical protein